MEQLPRITRIVWTDRGVEIRRGALSENPTVFEFRGAKKGFSAEYHVGAGKVALEKREGKELAERREVKQGAAGQNRSA